MAIERDGKSDFTTADKLSFKNKILLTLPKKIFTTTCLLRNKCNKN